MSACPYGVLQPALLEYGLSGLLQPRLDFAAGYCSYECNRCGQICPTGAIRPLDLTVKQTVQLGVAHFIRINCMVHTCLLYTSGMERAALVEHPLFG